MFHVLSAPLNIFKYHSRAVTSQGNEYVDDHEQAQGLVYRLGSNRYVACLHCVPPQMLRLLLNKQDNTPQPALIHDLPYMYPLALHNLSVSVKYLPNVVS